MDRDRVVGYLAVLTDDEYSALASEARAQPPLTPLQQARATGAAKAAQLWDMSCEANKARAVAFSEQMTPPAPAPAEPRPEPLAATPPQHTTFTQEQTGAQKAGLLQHMLNTNPEGI